MLKLYTWLPSDLGLKGLRKGMFFMVKEKTWFFETLAKVKSELD
jgi:hypothetical protein